MRPLAPCLTIAVSVLGAFFVSRLWPTGPSRLVALGVAAFGLLVVAAQLLGVVAAASRAPIVGPWTLLPRSPHSQRSRGDSADAFAAA